VRYFILVFFMPSVIPVMVCQVELCCVAISGRVCCMADVVDGCCVCLAESQ
jgi:hypothetical protein